MNDSFSAVAFHPPPLIFLAATCTRVLRERTENECISIGDAAPNRRETPLLVMNPQPGSNFAFFNVASSKTWKMFSRISQKRVFD